MAIAEAGVPTLAPGRGGAERGAALKESMRALLKKKASGRPEAQASAPDAVATSTVLEEDSAQEAAAASASSSEASPEPAKVSGEAENRSQKLCDALRTAPVTDGAGRGEALKSSMRKLLAAKSSSKGGVASSTVFEAVFEEPSAAGGSPSAADAEEVEDPWPEMRLSPTVLGLEDGKARATELARRGDYGAAYQMWSKVRYLARHGQLKGRAPSDILLAEIETEWAAAKENVPPPPPPAPPEPLFPDPPERRAPSPPPFEPAPRSEVKIVTPKPAAPRVPADRGTGSAVDLALKCKNDRAAKANSSSKATDSADARYDPTDWNHVFYKKMEKDYDDICATDGWDDIRDRQGDLDLPEFSTLASQEEIPADSDYFRVQLPSGAADRELRFNPASNAPRPQLLPVPRRPARNLDELRRVEAETLAVTNKNP